MRVILFRLAGLVALAALVLVAGCGDGKNSTDGSTNPAELTLEKNDLHQIGIAYHSCYDALGRGPKNADELAPFLENNAKIVNALKPGGKYIFHWGLSIPKMAAKQGTSNTILAYLQEPVGKDKRLVVYADASPPKVISEEEFKKQLKAQGN